MLHISCKEHRTNDYVRQLVTTYAGQQEPVLSIVKRRKVAWFGHVTRHTSLSKTILQGTVEGKRRRGRQRKSWMDNIKEWTSCSFQTLLRTAEDREHWRSLTAQASTMTPLRPPRPWDEWVSDLPLLFVFLSMNSLICGKYHRMLLLKWHTFMISYYCSRNFLASIHFNQE